MEFDIDVFISEVEARPAIWDLRCDAYSDRLNKTKAWEELCLRFVNEFEEMGTAEKNKAAAQLQRKWKSLRDSYNREVAKKKSIASGSAASSRKEYVYFQQLSFLSDLSDVRPVKNAEEEVHEANASYSPDNSKPINKKVRLANIEKRENEVLQQLSDNIKKKSSADEDADRNFFISLVPDFKKIHEDYRLDAKTEIMNIIKKYKSYTHPGYNFCNQQPMSHYQHQPTTQSYNFQSGYNGPQNVTALQHQRYSQGSQQEYATITENSSQVSPPCLSPTISEAMSEASSIIDNMFGGNKE